MLKEEKFSNFIVPSQKLVLWSSFGIDDSQNF